VSITPGTVYVASYYAPNGHYSIDAHYFSVDYYNAPLHAPSTGDSGGNAVYIFSATSTFPYGIFEDRNYWVDVVFQPTPP
jgi:hypothetical protein